MISAQQVTVGTSAVNLTPLDVDVQSVAIRNRGTAAIYLGDATVTTSNGFQLDAGDIVTIDLASTETVWAVAASNQTVHLLHTGVGS